jgi:integrase
VYIRKLKSGRYNVQVKHGGRSATATRATKAEAQQAGAELMLQLGGRPVDVVVTVESLLAGHLAAERENWSPTTWADIDSVARRLPAAFLARPVSTVSPAIVAGLYRQLTATGWSPHRLRRVRVLLSGAWKRAIAYEWATSNPTRDVALPKIERPDVSPPTTDEVRRVLDTVDGPVRMFLRLAAVLGARRGELVALQWSDVDLDDGTVTITRSLVQIPGAAPTERPTKTGAKGHRRLSIDEGTLTMLRRHRTTQLEQALAHGLPAPMWVFSHSAGVEPWRPDYISREFARARARAGVTGVRLHDVRHYVAVSMLQDGEAPADVAGQLGHASVTTTLSTYWRHLPGRDREATQRRASRLGE